MSECQTCSQDEFIFHEKAHLFEIFSNTVCRHKKQASVDLKLLLKQISNSFEIDSQLHDDENLSEESTLTSLKLKLSIMNTQDDDQNNDNEQQNSSQNTILMKYNAVIYQ